LNHSLKAKTTGLRHHNWAYRIAVGVFVWLMLVIYLPLTFLSAKIFRMLFRDDFETLKELAGVFAQKDLGIVLAVLCVIPIYLLSGLLKYNRIDASQDADEGDNVFSSFIPSP
jgi:hypothetical protein